VWNRVRGDTLILPDLDSWRTLTGLPWAVFWLRELLAWGTLEPVTAYVIASGRMASRLAAYPLSGRYRDWWRDQGYADREEIFHPRLVRRWYELTFPDSKRRPTVPVFTIPVRLTRPPTPDTPSEMTVLPSIENGETHWFDGAGYHLASSTNLDEDTGITADHDYAFYPQEAVVRLLR